MRVRAFASSCVPADAAYGILRARLQPVTDLHGAWHAWAPTPSRARGSTRLSICTERGKCGRARARALSGDVQMHGCASWAFGICETVPREAYARLRRAHDKTKRTHPEGCVRLSN